MAKPKVTLTEFKKLSEGKIELKNTYSMQNIYDRFSVGSFSQSSALRIGTFLSCVQDKAETVGQLPVKLYRNLGNGKTEQVTTGRLHRIFTQHPCDYLDMSAWLEMMVLSLETHGAFYGYIHRNDKGQVMEVIPFRHQTSVVPNMDQSGNVYYNYTTNDGRPAMSFYEHELIVVRKMSTDGVTPVRPLTYYANLLGIADGIESNFLEMQKKGITSQMGLTTESRFSDPNAITRLQEDLLAIRGANGFSKTPIFENGLKPISLKLTPQESELFNNRSFTDQQICAMTGVPMHRIRPNSDTKVDIDSLDEFYMRGKINPILVKFERVWNAITPPDITVKIDRKAFYAGSPWKLVEAVEREVKGGLAMVNEGRIDLGRDPVDGGDVFAIDNNNVTYGSWLELPQIRDQLYGAAPVKPQQNQIDKGDDNANQ